MVDPASPSRAPSPASLGPADVPSGADVRRAAEVVRPWVRRTPVLEVEVDGVPVILKLELMQHTASFKVRGAFASVLSAPQRPSGLVAASGGNHGLAVAHVGDRLGLPTRVFVPATAPTVKVEAIARLGAEVRQVGTTYAEALEASREAAAEEGVLALHAYDAPGTVAGQATLGLELAGQVPDVDTVLVAVGGGGLMAGLTLGLAEQAPGARVVAIEPETCPTLHAGLAQEEPTRVEVGGVAADALGASTVGGIALAVARHHDVRSLLVADADILTARRWLWRHVRVAAEPAGAAALVPLLTGTVRPRDGERVCVVVCGGNADPSDLG